MADCRHLPPDDPYGPDQISRQRSSTWVSRNSVEARTPHCLVTVMLFPLVVTVNPAVWVANEPLSEPAVRVM